MSHTQNDTFKDYTEKCRELKRDLEHALGDLKFRKEEGGTIRYAVDHSETYGYVHTDAYTDKVPKEFSLFDDPDIWIASFHRLALRHLFDDLPEKLILLRPYAIELQDFLRYKEQQPFEKRGLMEQVADALEERQSLIGTSEFDYVMKLCEKVESGESLTPEENSSLITFLRQNAPTLLAFYDRQDMHPLYRIKDLFIREKFENLEHLSQIEQRFDNEETQDLHDKLLEQRPSGSWSKARNDAAAIATVERVNKDVLGNRKTKLLLVTRSPTMHELFKDEPDSSPLRHPRIFSVLFEDDSLKANSAQQQLRSMLGTIDQFLEQLKDREDFAIRENALIKSWRDKELSEIREAWHSTEAFKASLRQTESHERDWEQSPEEIQRILLLLRDNENLQTLLAERLGELSDTLDWEHTQLAAYVQVRDQEQQDLLADLIDYLVAEDFGNKFVLKVSKTPLRQQLPYSLEFYTEKAKELLLNFFPTKGDSESRAKPGRREVLSFFQQGLRMDAEYEPLLAMAYVLGILQKWKLAEKYCEQALEIAGKASNIPVHEGKFFLAICMRKESPSVKRHQKAIRLLNEAIDPKIPDPRYLKEKATHILLLYTDWIAEGDGEFPHLDDALKLLDRAYEGSENDPVLRMRIVMRRLYYFVETGQIDKYEARVKKEYLELEKWQKYIEPDNSKWPPVVIDTIAWTRWNLLDLLGKDNASKKARIKVIEQLRQAGRHSKGKERARCQQHLDAVKEGKRRQNWMAIRAKAPVTGGETLA